MSVVEGFAGMRVRDGQLRFAPFLPAQWQSFAFKIRFRGVLLKVEVDRKGVYIYNQSDKEITVYLYDHAYAVKAQSQLFAGSEGIKV
jgi:maltose phosphorylase